MQFVFFLFVKIFCKTSSLFSLFTFVYDAFHVFLFKYSCYTEKLQLNCNRAKTSNYYKAYIFIRTLISFIIDFSSDCHNFLFIYIFSQCIYINVCLYYYLLSITQISLFFLFHFYRGLCDFIYLFFLIRFCGFNYLCFFFCSSIIFHLKLFFL